MSFRRKRDEWDEFLKRHGAELRACGVPDYVTADRWRFLRLLDHGFDESGWSVTLLAPEQAAQLATLIARHFGEEEFRFLLLDLRRQAGLL